MGEGPKPSRSLRRWLPCVLWPVALFLGCSVSARAQTLISGVAQASDGDSLSVSGIAIRLHGIDAPELAQTCTRQGAPWKCGEEAKRQLQSMVAGQRVSCRRVDTDDYGRAVAVCTAGNAEINKALVEMGWATAFRRYSDVYVPDELRAKAGGRGIWSSEFEVPADFRHRTAPKVAAVQRDRTFTIAPTPVASNLGQCTIKGNHSRRGKLIYHLPGMPYYAQTRAEEMFCTEAEAQAAGYRRSRADGR